MGKFYRERGISMRKDIQELVALICVVAAIMGAFALGMWTMWCWTNPAKSVVWVDDGIVYVETPDGNIWEHWLEDEAE